MNRIQLTVTYIITNMNEFTKSCINASARIWNILQCKINVHVPSSMLKKIVNSIYKIIHLL